MLQNRELMTGLHLSTVTPELAQSIIVVLDRKLVLPDKSKVMPMIPSERLKGTNKWELVR
jgi:hypothetical protein